MKSEDSNWSKKFHMQSAFKGEISIKQKKNKDNSQKQFDIVVHQNVNLSTLHPVFTKSWLFELVPKFLISNQSGIPLFINQLGLKIDKAEKLGIKQILPFFWPDANLKKFMTVSIYNAENEEETIESSGFEINEILDILLLVPIHPSLQKFVKFKRPKNLSFHHQKSVDLKDLNTNEIMI